MDNELDSEREATIQAALDEPNYLLRERTFGYSEGDVRWLLDTLRHERAMRERLEKRIEEISYWGFAVADYWHTWQEGLPTGIRRLEEVLRAEKAQAPTGADGREEVGG